MTERDVLEEARELRDEWRAETDVSDAQYRRLHSLNKLIHEVERLREQVGAFIGQSAAASRTADRAIAERDEALAVIERVREHHRGEWSCGNPRHTNPDIGCPDCAEVCTTCNQDMPCDTLRALDEADS